MVVIAMDASRSRSALRVESSKAEIEELATHFRTHRYARLPRLLHPSLLEPILEGIDAAPFREHNDSDIAVEDRMPENATLARLLFIANEPQLFRLVERITGCGEVRSFTGRVYRFWSGSDHHDSWHSDVGDGRMVAMSLNLSREVYSGGDLTIKEVPSDREVARVSNTGLGDALIFAIGDDLRHRVSPVTGPAPKTAFAGWFNSQPDQLADSLTRARRG